MKTLRFFTYIALLLGMSLLLAACGTFTVSVENSDATLVVTEQVDTVETSDLIEEPIESGELAAFQEELLPAIQSRDEMGLAKLMTENFTSGWWRGEMGDLSRADALRELYNDQLGSPDKVGTAANVDLKALMGGTDPLDILRPEVGVVSTLVMTGWGKDGEDEAILFIARQPDRSLRWAGTMVVLGGFTSPQTGGVQLLVNAAHGYQMYLPLGVEVMRSNPDEISIMAPPGSEGERGRVDITVEPAGGLTVEQVVEQLKSTVLSDVADQPATFFGLDTEMALVFDRVPSQEIMRLLFVVHEDRLYRMYFYPQDDAQPTAYAQMRNAYAVITNTFKFIPLESNGPVTLAQAAVVVDTQVFTSQLQQGLIERNKVTLQSMMGDSFSLATWRSEGIQITPGDAIQQILNNYVPLGVQPVLDLNHLVIANLYPQHPTSDAGEELIPVYAAGWGREGKDEAILFIARRADGSLYWQGVLTAVGGFSEARLDGVQHYNNVAGGYSVDLPQDTEITAQPDNHVVFIGPAEGPTRGMAFIDFEPAYGRTVEQVYEDVKADLEGLEGDFNLSSTTLWIDNYPALVVTGLPGQDVNRQIFIVQNDMVYHMLFMPDEPHGGEGYQEAYQQMLDLYAMIVNTFHFNP